MNKLFVTGQTAKVVERDPLVSGTVGAPFVVEFGEDWAGYSKTVCFRAGDVQIDHVNVGMDDQITIPSEVLAIPCVRVKVGIYGTKEGKQTPTVWCNLDTVLKGTEPGGGESVDPSLPVWAQILEMLGALSDLDTIDKRNLVAAINEVLRRIITDHNQLKMRDAANQHPIEAITGLREALDDAGHDLIVLLGQLADLNTTNKDSIVAAINEVLSRIVTVHDDLLHRDDPDQHPIKAITGLQDALDAKQPVGKYLTEESDPGIPIHNVAKDAHSDIRQDIKAINDKLKAFFDSDDKTLDELSEIVAYITNNKDLIDNITTSKVSVTDIVDDLVTNVSNKPLSAAQGVVLNGLIVTLTQALSSHTTDSTIHITQDERAYWNGIVPYIASSDGTPPEDTRIFWLDDAEDATEAVDLVVDPTLTEAWAAAEAKQTGKRIGELQAEKVSLTQLSEHNESSTSHMDIRAIAEEAKRIAAGRMKSRIFETKSDMETWLADPSNVALLDRGDNLYIVDLNTPDYWWDGTKIQPLEVEHPDLSGYATKVELSMSVPAVIGETDYKALENAGKLVPDRVYHVVPDSMAPKGV